MIAANYRKNPQAMAMQLPLPFGRVLVWATGRPTRRVLREIRAARARIVKALPKIVYVVKAVTPQWFREMKGRAVVLARAVKAACLTMI